MRGATVVPVKILKFSEDAKICQQTVTRGQGRSFAI